jgi:hypothetical protein
MYASATAIFNAMDFFSGKGFSIEPLVSIRVSAAPLHAESMDLALGRLRVVSGRGDCPEGPEDAEVQYCPNQEAFERLAAELSVSMAPLLSVPARTVGARGFALELGTAVTTLDAGAGHWRIGTEGSETGAVANASPDEVLVWNRATVRKGLPLGLEASASVARAPQTSLWAIGVALKLSLIEGFRTGVGRLPDLAVSVGTTRSFGSDQIELSAHTIDVTLSKPFPLGAGAVISPLLGLQVLMLDAESGLVDLTPGPRDNESVDTPFAQDAFGSCQPVTSVNTNSTPLQCNVDGTGADFANDARFDALSQARARLAVGAQTRIGMWLLSAALAFDLIEPALEASSLTGNNEHPRQVTMQLSAGLEL